jgi:Tfp pilus assembly protein PilO
MNLRDPKNQIFIIVLILICAVAYFWYTKVYESYSARAAALIQEQSVLADKLNSVKQKAATLDQLEEEYKEKMLRYKKVELLLPEKKEDEAFLSQIHAAAQLTGSVVMEITPLGTMPSEFYETNSYTVIVESSYHGLGRFLAKIANFPFIVNLSALQMKTTKEGSGPTLLDPAQKVEPGQTVKATFKLSTYNVKQGAVG